MKIAYCRIDSESALGNAVRSTKCGRHLFRISFATCEYGKDAVPPLEYRRWAGKTFFRQKRGLHATANGHGPMYALDFAARLRPFDGTGGVASCDAKRMGHLFLVELQQFA